MYRGAPAPPQLKEIVMATLADARKVIAAAEAKAAELGNPMNIAVADGGGNLITHVRMDDAWLGSIDISIKRAFTSRALDISTKELAKYSQWGGQFFGFNTSNNGRVMSLQVVGAIDVSGGSGEQDQAVAEAGAKAFRYGSAPRRRYTPQKRIIDTSAFAECGHKG